MSAISKFAKRCAIAASLLAAAIVPAAATPTTTYTFNGTFQDGATASGTITIAYGYLGLPTAIDTTSGIFSGFDYIVPGIPTNLLASNTVLVLSAGAPSWYSRYLYLDFSQPLGSGGDMNPLIAASSFECDAYGSTTFSCTGGADKIRYFASGLASVPEPAALSILGMGLIGAFALRRRRNMQLTSAA